ncbi:MAG: hypothetical protein KBD78_10240 [Oligoflexales bacterium]|nr:hypothetical protein [Oligoflexales bacterium]
MKKLIVFSRFIALFILSVSAFSSFASEVILTSNGLKTKEIESNGGPKTKEQSLSLGVLIENRLGGDLAYFAGGEMELVSYSGDNSPEDATNFSLRGGFKNYFKAINESFFPYVSAFADMENSKTLESYTVQNESTGLFYGVGAGLKMPLGPLNEFELNDWVAFLSIDLTIFRSALMQNEKKTTTNRDETSGLVTSTEEETKRRELYVKSNSFFNDISIGLGFQF